MSETKRPTIPDAEKILNKKYKILNDGFVRLIDYSGGDQAIIQAARVSYGKGTKKVSEDKGLIRYLMRHHHSTPFEMVELKFHVRVPMDCWRQWIRHRTANVNEYSTRYSIAIDEAQETNPKDWRLQSKSNKQGSSGFIPYNDGLKLSNEELEIQQKARKIYENRIKMGVAREQARKDLPLSTYTEAYWKIDLHNLFHFLGLRMDSHAQKEIRLYATNIGERIVSKVSPIAYQAFKDYRLNSIAFSDLDKKALRLILAKNNDPIAASEKIFGKSKKTGKLLREGKEFLEKYNNLDL
jgi:thymidylate synthase (FAD)